jgi:TolB-like protein/Tfp pilus assembly protein PilF
MPNERGSESVWVRLRNRKVVQWGLAYAAAAWALLQGVDFLADAFRWPDATRPLATLVLLLGLPIAVALAWYHGDRGEQRVSAAELTIILLLLLLGGGFIWFYDHGGKSVPATTSAERAAPSDAAATTDERPSIAVLPFENRSRLEDDAFFVDGIHDDILTRLSKVSALRVISRTSVARFRGTQLSLQQVAQQLGVTKVLEGGVQRAGERVRISVQLIDAATDAHLWAESYDRELTAANIFIIQSEVATAIAAALRASLTPAEQARAHAIPTEDLRAWQAYQLGKRSMLRRTQDGMREALTFFQAAIGADPAFALAWVGLADTLLIQYFYDYAPEEDSLAGAKDAIDRALTLDPDLAPAHASLGNAFWQRREYPPAEAAYRKAIALDPNYETVYHWYALLLGELGRWDESLQAAQQAVALDPLSPILHNAAAQALEGLGRFDEALARYERAIELDPAMPVLNWNISTLQASAFGREDEAVRWLEKAMELDPEDASTSALLSICYLDLGDDARAAHWLDRATQLGTDPRMANIAAAQLHLYRGEQAEALAYARRANEMYWGFPVSDMLRDADLLSGNWQAARARYAQAFPELLAAAGPQVDGRNYAAAIELALVLQKSGEVERAGQLLDLSEQYIRTIPRMGSKGYQIADVLIAALRGQDRQALAALRQAEQSGWHAFWRYFLKHDPSLDSIRDLPEFQAVLADIELEMATQRARLQSRRSQPR